MSYETFNNSASPSTPASAKTTIWANTSKRMFQKDDTGLELPLVSTHRVNVLDYGAKGDGATNDSTAIQNAINAAGAMGVSARGVDVYFPAGVYALGTAAPITVPFNNVMLIGEGWQSTILYYTAGTTGNVLEIGNGISKSGCGLVNMSVWKSAAATSGDNIKINAMNDCLIRDVVVNNYFRGVAIDSAAVPSLKVWLDHVEVNNGTITTGIGIQVTNGTGGDTYITDCVMSNNPASKPAVGIQLSQSGHCSILRCNVTSFIKGLLVNPVTSQDVTYLFIDHSLFDSCGTHGAHFNGTTAASSRIRSVVCANSWFSGTTTAGGPGIEFTATGGAIVDGMTFVGCRILNNQSNGITYGAAATLQNISFTDCEIAGNGAAASGTLDGISVAANAIGLAVSDCKIGQSGTAANSQRRAITVAAGTSSNLIFVNNDCQPNVTVASHGYIELGAITGGGNLIDNNQPSQGKARGDSRVAATAAITTTETIVTPAVAFFNRLAANGMRAGTSFRFRIWGSCTITTASGTWVARVRLGTANTTGDTAVLIGPTVTTSGIGGPTNWTMEIIITCRTVGGAATFHGTIFALQDSATLGLMPQFASAYLPTFAAGVTTNINYINATLIGSTNCSITVQGCTFEVIAP